ncbi:molybdopterin cofactor-binding domain-containing protein [Aestuariibius sp. 2305UL40-4]|uniref:xanthine dehydrogenase family protein molybdopterin-binding subunit n=1 Tax=Aestuariibius violaceus TaxID=3234132 RepID=UPI00345EC55F
MGAGKILRRTFLIGTAAIAGGVAFGVWRYRTPYGNPLENGLAEGEATLTPYIKIAQDGITIITPRSEVGQGTTTTLAALVAEELDVDLTAIKTDHGPPSSAYYNGVVSAEGFPIAATDTGFLARNGRAMGDVAGKFLGLHITGGSTSVPDGFDKMRTAGAVARLVLIQAAADRLGVLAGSLSTENGAVIGAGDVRIPYEDLAIDAAAIDPPRHVELKDPSNWRYLGKSQPRLDMLGKVTGTASYGIDLRLPDMLYGTVRSNPAQGAGAFDVDASSAEAMPGVVKVIRTQHGAGVLADNTWTAFRAAEEITFDWAPSPYPETSEEMAAALEDSLDDSARDSRFRNDGDADAPTDNAEVIEADYVIPFLAHAPLEPMNATAWFHDGRLEIWAGTQVPTYVVQAAADLTGLPEGAITLHTVTSGGSFGRRLEFDFILQAIELAREADGRPVKMTWSREEDFAHDFPRPMGLARMRGVIRDGQIDTFDGRFAYPSVVSSQTSRLGITVPGPDTTIVAGGWDQPFSIRNYRLAGHRAPEMAPVSSWRSVGASGNGFFHDCFLDELIHAAGLDPMEERIRLCWHDPSRKVLEAVAEMSSWGSPLPEGSGRGVAFCLSFGVPCAEVVEVSQTDRGLQINRAFAAADVGTALDPGNLDAQLSGGMVFGLGHAMNCELTYTAGGAPDQTNFPDYPAMRFDQCPVIETRILENGDAIRGIGEPGVPPAAPALANAIFAATGQRLREMPFNRFVDFA